LLGSESDPEFDPDPRGSISDPDPRDSISDFGSEIGIGIGIGIGIRVGIGSSPRDFDDGSVLADV